ncbi:hypothetical protein E2562_010305 [Oryza meyeriana var. granulata]|uniref:Uncharacterized protein n=1 Tax=Oryza meyeriana var. granulata TaxID=110450 RepID=A0A6G1F6A0_9ORYZ|nr:hypothetical protein E2562_010305 [Oryza meyeriana var. granulata]
MRCQLPVGLVRPTSPRAGVWNGARGRACEAGEGGQRSCWWTGWVGWGPRAGTEETADHVASLARLALATVAHLAAVRSASATARLSISPEISFNLHFRRRLGQIQIQTTGVGLGFD